MFSQYRHFALALAATSSITLGLPAWSQNGEQVLSEVGVAGANGAGYGVVRPDLLDKDGDTATTYTDWVKPNFDNGAFTAFAISPMGTALVLDGTNIMEFSSRGEPKNSLPVTGLWFQVPKGTTGSACTQLSEVTAFTVLNDGSLRIAGQTKGGGFVMIAVRENAAPTQHPACDGKVNPPGYEARLVANGTPPTITDLDSDEIAFDGYSRSKNYYAVGEKKKVIQFPIFNPWEVPNPATTFKVIATLNGKTIDSVTSFPYFTTGSLVQPKELKERPVVVLNTGEVLAIKPDGTSEPITYYLPDGAPTPPAYEDYKTYGLQTSNCRSPSRNDPQKFNLRADPSAGTLFTTGRLCNTVTIFENKLVKDNGGTDHYILTLSDAPAIPGEELAENPFVLNNVDGGEFFGTSLDWQVGQGGDFSDCTAADYDYMEPDPTATGVCQLGKKPNQAALWGVKVVDENTEFRMFQFNLVDCRWTGAEGCPVEPGTCTDPIDPRTCALNLTPLLIEADASGAFREAAFGDTPGADLPKMLIPANMRGEKCYDTTNADDIDPECNGKKDNKYAFHSIFAVNEAIFKETALIDFKINEFRTDSNDECKLLTETQTIKDLNETANLIVYNNADGFGTVNPPEEEEPFTKDSSIIVNSGCNGTGAVRRFSAYTVGLEFYCAQGDDKCGKNDKSIYIDAARRMKEELRLAKDQLICSDFDNPYYPASPDAMLKRLLSSGDCDDLEVELGQVEQKFETCADSVVDRQPGQENCSAFFTHVGNFRTALDKAKWPSPDSLLTEQLADPLDSAVLRFKPNYEGEIYQRLTTLEFFVRNYMINSPAPN